MSKKKSFSLIEVVISLGLISLLLGTLLYWYRSFTYQKAELQKMKWPLAEERYVYQRLQNVLPKANLPFYSTEDSLIFIFDNGTTPHPELSGNVLGKLFYNKKNKTLSLTIWPQPSKEKVLKEPSQTLILMDHVALCDFSFYYPPDPFKMSVKPDEVRKLAPQVDWQRMWHIDYSELPAMVKIHIKRDAEAGIKEHERNFVFELLNADATIIYPKLLI